MQGRKIVESQARGAAECKLVGNSKHVVAPGDDIFGKPSFRRRHDPVTDRKPRHAVAERRDRAANFLSRSVRQRRLHLIAAQCHEDIDVADATGGDLDLDLAGTRLRRIAFGDLVVRKRVQRSPAYVSHLETPDDLATPRSIDYAGTCSRGNQLRASPS